MLLKLLVYKKNNKYNADVQIRNKADELKQGFRFQYY